jgi:hypothetical protein
MISLLQRLLPTQCVTNTTDKQTPMPSAGFKNAIPANSGYRPMPQTMAPGMAKQFTVLYFTYKSGVCGFKSR